MWLNLGGIVIMWLNRMRAELIALAIYIYIYILFIDYPFSYLMNTNTPTKRRIRWSTFKRSGTTEQLETYPTKKLCWAHLASKWAPEVEPLWSPAKHVDNWSFGVDCLHTNLCISKAIRQFYFQTNN